jgi:hypothetical protein
MILKFEPGMSDRKKNILQSLRQPVFVAFAMLLSTAALFPQSAGRLPESTGRQDYSEELYIRTDRDVYIAGEQVFLKIYCMNGFMHTPSYLSRVAYVSLLDSLNNPLVQVKLAIPGSSGSGQIQLPDTISSGNYYISACTHWMKNFSPDLFSYRRISVINPFKPFDNIVISAPESRPGTVAKTTNPPLYGNDAGVTLPDKPARNGISDPVRFTVSTDKTSYKGREKVRIDITATDSGGKPVESDLVISLAKSFSLSDKDDQFVFPDTGDNRVNLNARTGNPVFLPEPDGHLICGTIKSTLRGEPLRNENIVLSFVGKTALCRFTTTDTAGRFSFVCTEYGTREAVIQPLSGDLDDYYVEIDNPFPESFSHLPFKPLSLDTARLAEINNAVISMQVRRIYVPYPVNTVSNTILPARDFYGRPDNSTLMSTFIRLTSLREAIKEIIPGVITTRKKGKTVINSIFRFKDKVTITNPLLIVDGVPVWDHEKVLAISIDKIEKVDVLNFGYIYSKIYIDGIIDITTYNGNLSETVFDKPVFRQEFEALQNGPAFRSPDYSAADLKETRIPDFRNTLYWNPDIRTDRQGKATVEFYTSDETGSYTVLVEGFTPDGHRGRTVSGITVTGQD